jgi:hypothetical protein
MIPSIPLTTLGKVLIPEDTAKRIWEGNLNGATLREIDICESLIELACHLEE